MARSSEDFDITVVTADPEPVDPVAATGPPTLLPLIERITSVGIVSEAIDQRNIQRNVHRTADAGHALILSGSMPTDSNAELIAEVCLVQLAIARDTTDTFHPILDGAGIPIASPAEDVTTAVAARGLACAVRGFGSSGVSREAERQLQRLRSFRPRSPIAAAHAVLAGVELAQTRRGQMLGLQLMANNIGPLHAPSTDDRTRVADGQLDPMTAVVAEALIAAGQILDRPATSDEGIELLSRLVAIIEGPDVDLSTNPLGRGAACTPIETWSLASACGRALSLGGDSRWSEVLGRLSCALIGSSDLDLDHLASDRSSESIIGLIGAAHAIHDARSELQKSRPSSEQSSSNRTPNIPTPRARPLRADYLKADPIPVGPPSPLREGVIRLDSKRRRD